MRSRRKQPLSGMAAWFLSAMLLCAPAFGQGRRIEVLADKDGRFKIAGQGKPEIVVKAGQKILLRIEARKGKTWDPDGAVHGLTLLHAKDRARVPGWNLELMPGIQEFLLTAPSQPGEYEVVCTVVCSDNHDGMRMRFVVVP